MTHSGGRLPRGGDAIFVDSKNFFLAIETFRGTRGAPQGATIFLDEIFSQENPSRLFVVSLGRPAQGATTSLGDGDTS